jgi:hypothetical protein
MSASAPNAYLARQVEAMPGYGIPAEDIATALGIERWVLGRDYRKELDGAAIKANAKVAESLFRKATGEGREAVTAAIFWLKTRAGWKETSVHELRQGRPLSELTDAELEARITSLQHLLAASDIGDNTPNT